MQTLIIADTAFAARERAMLSRLEVGLADEGVRVIHAMPTSLPLASAEPIGIQSTIIRYQDSGLPFTRHRRATDLAAAIEEVSDEGATTDVIHAFGAASWPVAIELARVSGAALLLELWRPGLLAKAGSVMHTAARGSHPIIPEFIVSEPSIAAALRDRAPRAKIHSAPWGVHAPTHPRSFHPADRTLAVAMLCDTGDPRRCGPALSGLLDAVHGSPDLLIFVGIYGGSSSREAALWVAARKLNLLDRLSLVPEMESRREPILQMDLLLLPEATGRQRTLTLEAMAVGMPVVAAADPFLESLEEGRTARLVRTSTPGFWSQAIRSILTDPTAAATLTSAAHEWVRSTRSASGHVSSVLAAYRQADKAATARVATVGA